MKSQKRKGGVLYGSSPPIMQDVMNLSLIHNCIYDLGGELDVLRTDAKSLAGHFSGERLAPEDIRKLNMSSAFLLMNSIAEYHGVSVHSVLEVAPDLEKKLLWVDHARSTRKVDCKRFLNYMEQYFRIVSRLSPIVEQKIVDDLSNLSILFDEGIIIPRDSLLPEILKARKATDEIAFDAVEIDMGDNEFPEIGNWKDGDLDAKYLSLLFLNVELLESSYLGIPLHRWDLDLPLIEYKYRRGAMYLPELQKTELFKQIFSLLIPEVYSENVFDLLKFRNSSEFQNFRTEVEKIYDNYLEHPNEFSNCEEISRHLKDNYVSEIEKIAFDRRPNPTILLAKNIVSTLHPIAGILVGGHDLYQEFKQKHAGWRFAISLLNARGKLKNSRYIADAI
jgi:hypothetical protein